MQGKTSLIDRFASMLNSAGQSTKQSSTVEGTAYTETIALTYRFLRKEIGGSSADFRNNSSSSSEALLDSTLGSKVANIWELGNGPLFAENLLQFAITSDTVAASSVVLVVDLTRPQEMSVLMEKLIDALHRHIGSLMKANSKLKKALLEATKRRLSSPSSSKEATSSAGDSSVDHLSVPLLILGTKYDEFQNLDPEVKKQIVRYLRAVAVHYGGSLIFTSTKSETLMKRVYGALDGLAFDRSIGGSSTDDGSSGGGGGKPTISTNPSKPVILPFGYDSFSRIGVPGGKAEVEADFRSLFAQVNLEQQYVSSFGDDPRTDSNFSEPEIDKMLEYKYMLISGGGGGEGFKL